MRNGEHHVKITTRQELFSALFQPSFFGYGLTFRAVPIPAGIIAVSNMPTLIANLLMTAKPGCSAGQNCSHNFALITIHCMVLSVFVAISSKNVGYFVLRLHICSSNNESRGLDSFWNISGEA
jgi:hypothetical protein